MSLASRKGCVAQVLGLTQAQQVSWWHITLDDLLEQVIQSLQGR
jgi:hypothetical protein